MILSFLRGCFKSPILCHAERSEVSQYTSKTLDSIALRAYAPQTFCFAPLRMTNYTLFDFSNILLEFIAGARCELPDNWGLGSNQENKNCWETSAIYKRL
jgi:hypothetical protein